ncbi:MAG: hypothetical protein J6Y56_02895 [Fibrobacterales bacterium]|nr:hypothetical protein [Fibrobacterales bacterium]
MLISLPDNQYKPKAWGDAVEKKSDGVDGDWRLEYQGMLEELDGVSLRELRSKDWGGRKFLIFPSVASEKELDKKDNFVFKLKWERGANRDKEPPAFLTDNVMGFFGLGGSLRMRITSRFDLNGKNTFLHYMLQKVCNVAVAPQTDRDEDEFYDFLPYLFPQYLQEACKQGIFRAYVTREYNDANVRGAIDVSRHIRYNIPFNGKIAYHTREYTTDNPMTQLVRHTIEFLRAGGYGAILDSDADVRDDVRAIEAATESYSRSERAKVVSKNLRPLTHPYYTAYEQLRLLCLAILRRDRLSYGDMDDEPIAGILFDGAALWEEYLAKVFEEGGLGLVHSNNRTGGSGIALFDGGRRTYYPDFYRKGEGETAEERAEHGIVLDAKYKRLCRAKEEPAATEETADEAGEELEFNGEEAPVFARPGRDDLYQMLGYMHCLPAGAAVLLNPYSVSAKRKGVAESNPLKACGFGGEISIMGIPIWTGAETFDAFSNAMKDVEKSLCEMALKAVV